MNPDARRDAANLTHRSAERSRELLRIMRASPWVTFYAYTKEISRFKRLVEPEPPLNFHWIYSFGGKEDHLIDLAQQGFQHRELGGHLGAGNDGEQRPRGFLERRLQRR